jgi:class 3 adenylate cyclase
MAIIIQENTTIEAFAMIVDVNGYGKMVAHPEANLIAQFTCDILYGGINSVEQCGGEVVGFMGDAFLAILDDTEKVFQCCASIAKDLNELCEYISSNSDIFPFSPKGPSLKIGIEHGDLDISTISSNFLGVQKLFAGAAINYAHRIMQAGFGNRCLFGPKAYKMGLSNYLYKDSYDEIKGKDGEPVHRYYKMNLGDIWRENDNDSDESYW